MPVFYSISLLGSVIGSRGINESHFHGYVNMVWWCVGEELWLVL
jgi:hypothetical protein